MWDMVNPLLTAPVEFVRGKQGSPMNDNGAKIVDKGEYLDSLTPYLNQVAGISGVSPWGTVGGLMGDGSPIPDPQRAVEQGRKDYIFNRNLANYLTGLGIQDTTNAQYQRIAANEIRRGGSS
jgi:hypothetical protein